MSTIYSKREHLLWTFVRAPIYAFGVLNGDWKSMWLWLCDSIGTHTHTHTHDLDLSGVAKSLSPVEWPSTRNHLFVSFARVDIVCLFFSIFCFAYEHSLAECTYKTAIESEYSWRGRCRQHLYDGSIKYLRQHFRSLFLCMFANEIFRYVRGKRGNCNESCTWEVGFLYFVVHHGTGVFVLPKLKCIHLSSDRQTKQQHKLWQMICVTVRALFELQQHHFVRRCANEWWLE